MSSQTVARRYATALADVLKERGEEGPVQSELRAWEKMIFDNPRLLEVLSNPTVAYEQQRMRPEYLTAVSLIRRIP